MSQEKIERWNEVNGNDAPQDKLTAFLDSATDSYAILQLRRTEDTIMERFESMASLHRQGKEPIFDHYEVVYVGDLSPYTNQNMMLESLYEKFNIDHPSDFRGHSLSVSDIVALKTAGVVSCHYVDSIGFAELPGFMKPENYLKNAEMAMEDDYGMIDGIINNGPKQPTVADLEAQVKAGISISLMDLAEAAHREKKKSVLEQLKSQSAQERPHKTASKKSAEKEL